MSNLVPSLIDTFGLWQYIVGVLALLGIAAFVMFGFKPLMEKITDKLEARREAKAEKAKQNKMKGVKP